MIGWAHPNYSMDKPAIIKKSPIVIVRNFIFLQIAAVGAFFGASFLANYAAIYRSLTFSRAISFKIAEALFILVAEIVIVLWIFFKWYKESYRIRNKEIIHVHGVLYRRETAIPLEQIISVSYRQSPLGKLTKYGIIELTGSGDKIIRLRDIPLPEEFAELVLKSKRSSMPRNTSEAVLASSTVNIQDLLNKHEHENLEFKSTFRWDTKQNTVNRGLEKSVMKTIAGFLNSQGGHLVIGINDNKTPVGLALDYSSLVRKDADGFENHFSQVFNNTIGAEFRRFVKLSWHRVDDKECCVASVSPSPKPAYFKNDNNEEFYIRTGNGTTALKLSEAKEYIDAR